MSAVRTWFWPAFALVYPFVVWPFTPSLEGVVRAKHFFVLGALLLGLFLELTAHPQLHLRDLTRMPAFLRRHPPLVLALLLAFWMGLSTAFSPQPEVALTGSLAHGGDGLIWSLMMVGVLVLGYLRALADPGLGKRVAWAVVGGASLLALGAGLEVLTQRGLYYPASPGSLPLVTFPGKGHLAAYFVLGFGVAAGLYLQGKGKAWSLLVLLGLSAFALGLTYNRAGIGGVALAALLVLWKAPRKGLVVLLVAAMGIASGWKAVALANPGGGREVASAHTFFTRLYFWKAALGGIAERPLLGWGGGVFESYWASYLSHEDKTAFVREELGREGYTKDYILPPGPVVFILHANGETQVLRIYLFRAHNFMLEIALKWGVPGLVLFLLILVWSVLARGEWALRLGLVALLPYLLMWFLMAEYEPSVYLVLGLLCAKNASRPQALA